MPSSTYRLLRSLAPILLLLPACGGGSGGGGSGGGGGGGNEELDPGRIPDLGASEFLVTPAFGTPADGSTTVVLELRLISLTGRPVGGAEVELEISGCGNLWQPLPPTDLEGRTRGELASTAGERKTIRARTESGGRLTEFPARTAEFLLIPDDSFFVRVAGSDARSGRSPREAWRTLDHALAQVPPGATIHVGAGVYAGPLVLSLDSSATNPLVLAGDRAGVMSGDAGAVVIEAGGASAALTVRATRNVVLQGLSLRGAEAGLRIEDSSDVRVLACLSHDNDSGLVVQGADGLVVQDCRISANRVDGLRVADTRRTRIENNLVYANARDGLVLGSPNEALAIQFNTFHRNGRHHLREESAGGTGTIAENILTEGGDYPLDLALLSDYQTDANMLWANVEPGPSRGFPAGSVEADPLFVDPFGPDGILGGIGADDDDFRLLPGSEANDLGGRQARDVVLGSQESLATRTTRSDGVLEWSGPDLPATNLGFHGSEPVPPFRSLTKGGGRIVFTAPGDVHLHAASWDRDQPSAIESLSGPALDAEVTYLEQRASPLDGPEELVAAQVDTGSAGRIVVRSWDGRRWNEPALAPFQDGIPRAQLVDRRFDIEYEGLSGDALFVVADGDGVPSYRVLARGGWSELGQVGTGTPGDGRVALVELVVRPGSDELALLTLDDRRDLVVRLWDGSTWGAPRLLALSTLYSAGWQPFGAAFETFSGDLVVTWGFNRFAEQTRWATLERTTGDWRFGLHPSTEATATHVVLASDPASDRIAAVMGEGDLDNDVIVSIWDGSDWVHTAELTLAGPLENRGLELAWLGNTGVATAFFRRQGHSGSFNVAHFFPTGWRIQPDVVLPGVDKAAKLRLSSLPDTGRLLGLVLDIQGRLFPFRFDGTRFLLLNGGLPLASGFDPEAPGRPFDLAVRRPTRPELVLK